jgi:protein-disulfide isomerase-like protein with CxxC motif
MIKLDIMSDPICPWCYIGKSYLDKALSDHPDHPFTIEWHPFQLNPDMPAGGMDRRAYLEGKFGGKDGAVAAYAPVVQSAEDAGLTINFDAMQRTPNTLNAHRLIHWAGVEGRQTAAVSQLFQAYFVEGSDIGDAEVLSDIADGILKDEARHLGFNHIYLEDRFTGMFTAGEEGGKVYGESLHQRLRTCWEARCRSSKPSIASCGKWVSKWISSCTILSMRPLGVWKSRFRQGPELPPVRPRPVIQKRLKPSALEGTLIPSTYDLKTMTLRPVKRSS